MGVEVRLFESGSEESFQMLDNLEQMYAEINKQVEEDQD